MAEKTTVHLTSVHSRKDIRIYLKQCRSLAMAGYRVFMVVADGQGYEYVDGVEICDIGKATGRIDRIARITQRIFKVACGLEADLYHLHDPELLPIGLQLKRLGKKVIFDSHEDVPRQFLYKPYLNRPVRLILSKVYLLFEMMACKRMDAIVTATPFIRDKFLKINPNSIDIKNYPIIDEFSDDSPSWPYNRQQVCYVGGIGSIRGIREMVRAMELTESDARLVLGGRFSESSVEREVKKQPGWQRVDEFGWIDRDSVRKVLGQSKAGLVTLHPISNYLDALPVKMFEYMAAGLPVIASNFPLWRRIIERNKCGISVDPLNPKEIANAIDQLVTNPKLAEEMGRNGCRAVEEKYNWRNEEKKLFNLYGNLII